MKITLCLIAFLICIGPAIQTQPIEYNPDVHVGNGVSYGPPDADEVALTEVRFQNNNGGNGGTQSHLVWYGTVDSTDTRIYDSWPLQPESNAHWIGEGICCNPTTIAQEHIAALRENRGAFALVGLEWIFFSNGRLYPNWQARGAQYLAGLGPYRNLINAALICDEAYEVAAADGVSIATMETQLHLVTAWLRQQCPQWLMFGTCQFPTINGHYDLSMFQYVGFDNYSAGFADEALLLKQLELELTPSQGVFLIPFAFTGQTLPPNSPGWTAAVADRLAQAPLYFELAKSDPKVKGLFPFMLQSSAAFGVHGFDSMPAVWTEYQSIGKAITGR
jgi:hypothetical protein